MYPTNRATTGGLSGDKSKKGCGRLFWVKYRASPVLRPLVTNPLTRSVPQSSSKPTNARPRAVPSELS